MTPIDVRSNPAMPGLVTIKIIDDAAERLEFSDGVPQPFEVEFSENFRDPIKISGEFIHFFKPNQLNLERLFFKISTPMAIAKLKELKEQEDNAQNQLDLKEKLAQQENIAQYPRTAQYQRERNVAGTRPSGSFFESEKLQTLGWWILGIVGLLIFSGTMEGDGGGRYDDMYENHDDMYENSRRAPRR